MTEGEEKEVNNQEKEAETTSPEGQAEDSGGPSQDTEEEAQTPKDDKLKLTPREPRLWMEPRRVLQIKRAPGTTHPGGISTEVEVVGFEAKYTERLKTLIRKRQNLLGTYPASQSEKSMKTRMREFYTLAFEGETGLLQLVYFEFKYTKHCHTKRPPNSYCFRCRLIEEARQMSGEVWENESEKKEEVVSGGNEDDCCFGEEAGNVEDSAQATLEEQVFEKGSVVEVKAVADTGTKKRKQGSKSDPVLEALAAMQKRMDDIAEDNRELKRRLKKKKKKKHEK